MAPFATDYWECRQHWCRLRGTNRGIRFGYRATLSEFDFSRFLHSFGICSVSHMPAVRRRPMGLKTGIEWTDATWNPITGCTKVTAGCDHCYAETLARKRLHDVYVRRAPIVDTSDNRSDPFAVQLWPERLSHPQKWAEPRMVFVNSMSDLFHSDVPDEFALQVFEAMLR